MSPGNRTVEQALAVDGGPPVFPEGPPDWPRAEPAVQAALDAVYRSGDWGRYHGRFTRALVDELCARHAKAHAWLCSSGTVAVELALRGAGVGTGDEVILAAYDFPGNFRAIELVGARPVLVDIRRDSWCLDASQIEQAAGPQTKAIIVSHLHGGLADMAHITAVARRLDLAVIEDACQAPGGSVGGRPTASWGDAGVLSFGGSKLLTAGRGGAIVSDDPQLMQRIKVFAERGNDAFPMSQLQAAVLLPQVMQLPTDNQRRQASARRLIHGTQRWPGLRPVAWPANSDAASYYKLAWLYDPAVCDGRSRDQFLAAVRAEGVALDAGFRGFTRRSARRCRTIGPLPHALAAAQQTVLLHHPVLWEGPETVRRVHSALEKVIRAFSST